MNKQKMRLEKLCPKRWSKNDLEPREVQISKKRWNLENRKSWNSMYINHGYQPCIMYHEYIIQVWVSPQAPSRGVFFSKKMQDRK